MLDDDNRRMDEVRNRVRDRSNSIDLAMQQSAEVNMEHVEVEHLSVFSRYILKKNPQSFSVLVIHYCQSKCGVFILFFFSSIYSKYHSQTCTCIEHL